MLQIWQKPEFQELSVNGECTAYSGTSDANQADRLLAVRVPAAITLTDRLSANEADVTDSPKFN
jgi:hypothetical protein